MNFYHTSLLDAVALKFLSVKPYSIYQLQKSIVERIGEVVKTNAVSYCLRRLAKKGYTLTGYESADNCWAFRGSDWRSKEPYEELL